MTAFVFVLFVLFVVAYLIGSIPFGLILTKAFTGQDLREIGSKNIGTTNVLRTGNKLLAFITLVCDMGKGGVPVLIAFVTLSAMDGNYISLTTPFTHVALIIGTGAVLGHCFPLWLRFKGGKGVATTFGVFLAATPYSGFAAIATWLAVAVSTRYSSLSALCACALAPVVTFFIYGYVPAMLCVVITGIITVRHKDNIKRLLAREESKIGQKGGNVTKPNPETKIASD